MYTNADDGNGQQLYPEIPPALTTRYAAQVWRAWGGVFIFAMLISLVAYGIALTGAIISIDEEIHSGRTGATIQWIAQDRWGMYLLNWLLLPNPVLPFLPLVVGLFANATAATVAVSLWCTSKATPREYLAAAFIVITPVSAFVHQFDTSQYGFFIGVLASVLSVKLFVNATIRSRLLGLVLLVFAISVYQAVALVAVVSYLVWFLGKGILQEVHLNTPKRLIINGLLFGAWLITGAVLHKLSALLTRTLFTNGDGYSLVDGLYDGELPRKSNAFFNTIKEYFWAGMWPMGWQTTVLVSIAALATIVVIVSNHKRNNQFKLLGIAAMFGIFVSPFLLVILTSFPWPTRTMLGIPFAIAGLVWIGLACKALLLRWALVLASIVCSWHYVESINRLMYSDLLSWQHDHDVALQLQEHIITERGTDSGDFRIIVIGAYTPPATPAIRRIETIGASIFEWDRGNPYRVAAILKFLGSDEASGPSLPGDIETALGVFPSMPMWPIDGSVKSVGDVVIVKFGDPTHPQQALFKKHGLN